MSILSKVKSLGRSPKNRSFADRLVRAARDPKNRRQLEQLRRRMAERGRRR